MPSSQWHPHSLLVEAGSLRDWVLTLSGALVSCASALQAPLPDAMHVLAEVHRALPPPSLKSIPQDSRTPTFCALNLIPTPGPLHWLPLPPGRLPQPHMLSACDQLLFSLALKVPLPHWGPPLRPPPPSHIPV